MALRIVSGIMLPAFLMSIIVQYNDPDGAVWMLIYGLPAAMAIMGLFGQISLAALPASFFYTLGFALQMPWDHLGQLLGYVSTWHMTDNFSEYAREAIGLLICAAYFDFLTIIYFMRRRTTLGA